MKNRFIYLFLIAFLAISTTSSAAVFSPAKTQQANDQSETEAKLNTNDKEAVFTGKTSRAERRAFRKQLKAELKEQKKAGSGPDAELIVLIILGLLLPPLAMYLYDREASGRFWISLGLLLLSIPLWGRLGALAALGSVVYTLYIIISESV